MAEPNRSSRRVTIDDIARHAGVSKGAVSYALNGRVGVSDATRARILAIADELGWYPNRAARSLSAARADACGFVIARPASMLALEPFYMEFLSGVEAELSSRSIALTIQLVANVAEEIEVYRRWWAERRVDGVMMVDLRFHDPRVPALAKLGLPAVVVGGPLPDGELPAVWNDEVRPIVEAVRYVAALGHTRIARVAGPSEFVHTAQRTDAFEAVVGELGLQWSVVNTDYSTESGARATRLLFSRPDRPTAVLFDSDVLAVTGLGVAQEMGLSVPDDVSIIAWDDSLMCQVVHPSLTTMTRDVAAYGTVAARRLLEEISGSGVGDVAGPPAELHARASTGRA
jgi:DNA-binding LacI/PurR family transcriptional regulator